MQAQASLRRPRPKVQRGRPPQIHCSPAWGGLRNLLRERIAALRGARSHASLIVMSRSLRSARSRRLGRPSLIFASRNTLVPYSS